MPFPKPLSSVNTPFNNQCRSLRVFSSWWNKCQTPELSEMEESNEDGKLKKNEQDSYIELHFIGC